MFIRPLSLLLLCAMVVPAEAQVEEPSGVILRGAVRDTVWTPDTVPAHVQRCRSRQRTVLIFSPISGYLLGIAAYSLVGGPWEGPKPANASEVRRLWGFIGAALTFAAMAAEVERDDCSRQPIPERPAMRRAALLHERNTSAFGDRLYLGMTTIQARPYGAGASRHGR